MITTTLMVKIILTLVVLFYVVGAIYEILYEPAPKEKTHYSVGENILLASIGVIIAAFFVSVLTLIWIF